MKRTLLAVVALLIAAAASYAGPKKGSHYYEGTVLSCGTSGFYETSMPACKVAFPRVSNDLDSDSKEDIIMVVTTIAFGGLYNGTLSSAHAGKAVFTVGEKIRLTPINGSWGNSAITSIYYCAHMPYTDGKGKVKEEIHLVKMGR